MKDRRFDDMLADVFSERVKDLSMDSARSSEILDKVRQERKENPDMRRNSKKKLLLAVAVMCTMVTMVAVAAGKIAYTTVSTSTSNPTYREFEKVKEAEKKLGQPIHAVKEFANGVVFETGDLVDVECMDEAGNKVGFYPELMLNYKGAGKIAFLTISKPVDELETEGRGQTEVYNDVNMKYLEENYLFLPPDAVVSAADQELEKSGKLYISYGSTEEERKTVSSVKWKDGDLTYLLMSWEIKEQELVTMAKEVIDAESLK